MSEITVTHIDDGAIWRVTFSNGNGNVLDHETMAQLTQVFRQATSSLTLKAICLEGAGEHFSFGVSVHEHLPAQVAEMLATFRDLAFAMLESDVVVVGAVRGQCLGGGLELATLCNRLIADVNAKFAQPEILLGVFAPVGSIALADRVGRAAAEDLCLTGRSIDAGVALGMGLVSAVSEQPAEAAIDWIRESFASLSASSLRYAVRALRYALVTKLRTDLPVLEAQYLNGLMQTADAVEGLTASTEKRSPVWKNV